MTGLKEQQRYWLSGTSSSSVDRHLWMRELEREIPGMRLRVVQSLPLLRRCVETEEDLGNEVVMLGVVRWMGDQEEKETRAMIDTLKRKKTGRLVIIHNGYEETRELVESIKVRMNGKLEVVDGSIEALRDSRFVREAKKVLSDNQSKKKRWGFF